MRIKWHHQRFPDFYGDEVLGWVAHVKGHVLLVHESPYVPNQGWYCVDGTWCGVSSLFRAAYFAKQWVQHQVERQPWHPHPIYRNTFVRCGATVSLDMETVKWRWATIKRDINYFSKQRFATAEAAMRAYDKIAQRGIR